VFGHRGGDAASFSGILLVLLWRLVSRDAWDEKGIEHDARAVCRDDCCGEEGKTTAEHRQATEFSKGGRDGERERERASDITTGGAKVAVVSSARELEVQVRYVLGIQAAAEKAWSKFPAPKEPVGLPPDAERATPRIEG
jgi:hypothetical protein